MTKPAVKKGLEILSNCQNIDALRRLIVMTIVGRNLRPVSANEETLADDSLSALLSRLPTKPLAEVASISKGKTGIKDALPGPFPLVVTAETRSSADHFDFEGPAVMIPMVSSTGHGDASLKRIHFQDGQYAVGSILAVVHPKDSSVLSARYLHAYLSAFKDELLVSRMVGTANVSLTVAKIGTVPVPLLPIQGQHEIAELMALCDQLEAEQADASVAHARLVETLLGTLTQSTDAADLAANWQRLAEHFDTLFTTEASIDALKQAVLQLAVRGKLVRQDPDDEPARELVTRIVAGEKTKKAKSFLPLGEDDQPFALPDSWQWVRFGMITENRLGKMLDAAKNRGDLKPYLRNTNVQWWQFELDDIKEMRLAEDELAEFRLMNGDLLICEGGEPGRCAIWRADIDEMYFQKALHRARPLGGCISEFLQIVLRQDAVSGALNAYFTGATIKHFPGDKLNSYAIPLPPVAEQRRIVAKVDELMMLCDCLQANIAAASQHQAALADTLIESALEAA